MSDRNSPRSIWLESIILGAMGVAGGCGRPPSAATAQSDPAPTTRVLGFAPVSFFQQHCARCHGAYGALYPDDMGRRLDDAALGTKVREMVAGPAAASLGNPALGALIAYHRSLIDGHPFVAVVSSADGVLVGEATPGATLDVESKAGAWTVSINAHEWRAQPPGGRFDPPAIRAEIEGRSTSLDTGRGPNSHETPAPKPGESR